MTTSTTPGCATRCGSSCSRTAATRRRPNVSPNTRIRSSTRCVRPRRACGVPSGRTACRSNWPCQPATGWAVRYCGPSASRSGGPQPAGPLKRTHDIPNDSVAVMHSADRPPPQVAALGPARVGDEAVRREQHLGDAPAAGRPRCCGRCRRRGCCRCRLRCAGPAGRHVSYARREQRYRRGDEHGGQPLGRQPPAAGLVGIGIADRGTRNSPHAWVSFWSCAKGSGARAITHLPERSRRHRGSAVARER